MAMTVRNNEDARLTLGQLNKNDSNLKKTLSKVSTGQKIVNADDDSSGYSISERMRDKIRTLSQDNQNVQNGSSMLRIAERGVDQIVKTLRTMKELAIDAANDSNTDEDRRVIQKELDQCRATIDDIALGTQYNGKILLDGRYANRVSPLENGSGGKNTTVQDISKAFIASTNARVSSQRTNGGDGAWQFEVDASFIGRNFSVELDFTRMKATDSYPKTLQGQGFTILCGGCAQYINVLFDADKTASQSTYSSTPGLAEDGSSNPQAREFIIGVKTVKSAKALAKAIFDGVSAVSDQIQRYGYGDSYYSYNAPNTANDILLDAAHDVRIKRDARGKVYITKKDELALQILEGTIPNPLTVPIPPVKIESKESDPLWIQHGTQAGQRTHVFIGDMQTDALGINDATVVTKEKANEAIGIIEGATEIALDEATNLGAYLQRMETTDSNVTTMGENVQHSESTIRDADMAKEMVNYTKSNILKQSSQVMFAQANQNGEAVLGLLQ